MQFSVIFELEIPNRFWNLCETRNEYNKINVKFAARIGQSFEFSVKINVRNLRYIFLENSNRFPLNHITEITFISRIEYLTIIFRDFSSKFLLKLSPELNFAKCITAIIRYLRGAAQYCYANLIILRHCSQHIRMLLEDRHVSRTNIRRCLQL